MFNTQFVLLSSTSLASTLDLNFVNRTPLDSRITFTRASGATYFDATGTLQTAAANAPRFDYGPTPGGVSNFVLNSQSGSLGYNGTSFTMVTSGNIAPLYSGSSVYKATCIVTPGDNNCGYAGCGPGVLAVGTTATTSVWVWVPSAYTGTAQRLSYDGGGTLVSRTDANLSLRNQWQRISLTYNITLVNQVAIIRPTTISAGDYFYQTAWQTEFSTTAGDYVPTSGPPANVGATPLGLLIEEQRTNAIRNPRAEGAVASATMSPPAAPTLGQTVGGALTGTTYYVKTTYVDGAGGETLVSPESSFAVTAANLLTVASPASSPGAVSWRVYVSTSTGTETQQATTAIGTNWTEPASGLVAGAAMPGSATAKTPGTMPTNWSVTLGTGLTSTVVGTGTENGVPYLDVQIAGTTTGAVNCYLQADAGISAASGQTWTYSSYLRLVAGSLANINTRFTINEFQSGAYLTQGNGSNITITASPLVSQRTPYTYTTQNASTNQITGFMTFIVTSAATYNFTLRIGAPQLEQGAFATSLVLPAVGTPAATTRAADSATMATGPWYNSNAASLVVDATLIGSSATIPTYWAALDDTSLSNRLVIRHGAGLAQADTTIESGGVFYASGVAPLSLSVGVPFKYGISASSGVALSAGNGGTVTQTNSIVMPSPATELQIGSGNTGQTNGYIRRVRYWPRALATNELQQVTT